jgi:hypothetical protein
VNVVLREAHGLQGLLLGAKILPAHDLAISELEHAADWDVCIDATLSRSNMDRAPREHPLAEIEKLVVRSNFSNISSVSARNLSMPANPRKAPSVAARRGTNSTSG